MFALIAAIIFAIAAFGVKWDAVNILYVGLFFLALALIFPWSPVTLFTRRSE